MTLAYGAHDTEHNDTVALRNDLEAKMSSWHPVGAARASG
jgi:hypothetical protein